MRSFIAIVRILVILLICILWAPRSGYSLDVILLDWVYTSNPPKSPEPNIIDHLYWENLTVQLGQLPGWNVKLSKDDFPTVECGKNLRLRNHYDRTMTNSTAEDLILECETSLKTFRSNNPIVVLLMKVHPSGQHKWKVTSYLFDLRDKTKSRQTLSFKKLDNWDFKRWAQDNGQKLYKSIRGGLAEGPWTMQQKNDPESYECIFSSTLEAQKVKIYDIYEIDVKIEPMSEKIIVIVDFVEVENSDGSEFSGLCYNVAMKNDSPGSLAPAILDQSPLELKWKKLEWGSDFDFIAQFQVGNIPNAEKPTIEQLISHTKELLTHLPYQFWFANQSTADLQGDDLYVARFVFLRIIQKKIRTQLKERIGSNKSEPKRFQITKRENNEEMMGVELVKKYLQHLSTSSSQ